MLQISGSPTLQPRRASVDTSTSPRTAARSFSSRVRPRPFALVHTPSSSDASWQLGGARGKSLVETVGGGGGGAGVGWWEDGRKREGL